MAYISFEIFIHMKNSLFIFAIVTLFTSCKGKEKGEPKKFISVLSLIEKQVTHIDTSLYAIIKVVTTDSLHSDTFYISRENFRAEATVQKIAKRYNEETRFDELLNRVIITYTPQKPEKEEIQKQEILVTPNIAIGDKVNNIIIESVKSDRNGYLEKKMLWQVDHSFLITTTTQQPGKPEIVTTTRVTWNDHSQE